MNAIDKKITRVLREADEQRRAEHEPSGKLSASNLGRPLLEQVLKIIGVPTKAPDDYTLRLFERGNQAEQWLVDVIKPEQTQVEVEYRNCIGVVDAIYRDQIYEIKSTKNSALKWIKKSGAKWSHILQGGLYALALNKPTFNILYISSEDFQTQLFEIKTKTIEKDINKIIDEVQKQLDSHILPEYEPREPWQDAENYQKYALYPEWIYLSASMAMKKLKRIFPEAYGKLTDERRPI